MEAKDSLEDNVKGNEKKEVYNKRERKKELSIWIIWNLYMFSC